jgi:hypothetical protein
MNRMKQTITTFQQKEVRVKIKSAPKNYLVPKK